MNHSLDASHLSPPVSVVKILLLTFLLLGLLVADGEADRHGGMEDVAVAVTAVAQQRAQRLAALVQQKGLLQVHQVLTARLVVAAQNVLHQGLLLEHTDRQHDLVTGADCPFGLYFWNESYCLNGAKHTRAQI